MNWNNETVLITGQTGTFGTAMSKKLLELNVKKIIGTNRNETSRTLNEIKLKDNRIKRYTCDIFDVEEMEKIIRVEKPTIIILAAAMKHINYCEEHPSECFKTNVYSNQKLIDLAIKYEIPKVLFLSTDKATNPTTIYGTSKLIIEQYIDCINSEKTTLLKSRYGNILGSNGSVLQIWSELKRKGLPITVTNPNMTRFFMSIEQAVELIICALENGKNKDLWVYNNKSCTIKELANSVSDNQIITGTEYIEKTDEALLSINELNHSELVGDYYIVNRNTPNEYNYMHPFTSDNAEKYDMEELKSIIKEL